MTKVQHKDGFAAAHYSHRPSSAVFTTADSQVLVIHGHSGGIGKPGPWMVRHGAHLHTSLSRRSRLDVALDSGAGPVFGRAVRGELRISLEPAGGTIKGPTLGPI